MVMAKFILKRLWDDIKRSKGQFIAFILVVAVGAFFYAGLTTYSHQLSSYTKSYFQEHHLSDLNVSYRKISPTELTSLSKIQGIKRIEGRYAFEATQTFSGYKASLVVHSLPANDQINTPAVIVGHLPSEKGAILLDSNYAKQHHINVGDQITVHANGENLRFTVTGLGEDVEYAKVNATQDHTTSGIAYVPESAIPEVSGDGLYYNEVVVEATKGYSVQQLGKSIEVQSRQEHLTYLGQVSKQRTFSYSQLQQTIYNNGLMSVVIPFVLYVIEAIILYLAMSRMIDSQRGQIGVMKALGVKSRTIMMHYMGYPLLIGIIGSILGCIVADKVFIPMVAESSARAYSLPGIQYSLALYSVLPPVLFSSAFGMLSCYLSGRAILKERAAQTVRPKPPRSMRKLFIERVPGLWHLIPYGYKIIPRNIFLNKKRAVATLLGVLASTVLLITAFSTQASLLQVANQSEKVYSYNLRVDYSAGTPASAIKFPSGIEHVYSLSTMPVEFTEGKAIHNANLVVTAQADNLIHFFDANDHQIFLKKNGVLVPKSYADKYHISVGDTIQLRFSAPQMNNKTVSMKVSAISTQYSNPSFYGTSAYLKSVGIDPSPTFLLVEAQNPTALAGIRHFFEQDPHVSKITDRRDLQKSTQYILKQNTFVFVMFIICAAILSFSAIYTISSINIYERTRELATLKVLGYQRRNIMRLVFRENTILTGFAAMVALPISGWVYRVIVQELSSAHQQIPDTLNPSVVLESVALAFLLTTASNLLLRRKVTNINMIESLKSIE